MCAPGNSSEVVRELSKHPQVLADVLSLSAASDGARLAAASEAPFPGVGKVPCIELLRGETACAAPPESYQASELCGEGAAAACVLVFWCFGSGVRLEAGVSTAPLVYIAVQTFGCTVYSSALLIVLYSCMNRLYGGDTREEEEEVP